MNNILISSAIGLAAAIIDVVPMILKKLDRLFILSAFSMWVIVGFATAYIRISGNNTFNGILVALLFFIPLSFLIFKLDPSAFFQVCLSTVLLGAAVGFSSGILIK